MTTGIYQSLAADGQEIRLLHVQSGDWSDKIRCNISTVSLESKLQFRALSYVWGKASITHTISVEGYPLPVTVNLASALRRLRQKHEEIVIWVDAVCINQEDVEERNSQVALMSSIYANSEEVVVWLGEANDETYLNSFDENVDEVSTRHFEAPLNTVTKILTEGQPANSANEKDRLPTAVAERVLNIADAFDCLYDLSHASCWCQCRNVHVAPRDAKEPPRITSECTAVIASLASRAWWRRVWTVQEIMLPPRAVLYYDFASCPWSTLQKIINNRIWQGTGCVECGSAVLEHAFGEALMKLRGRAGDIENSRWLMGRFNLFDTYSQFRTREATDPRDMVYALATGLCSHRLATVPEARKRTVLPYPVDIDYRKDHVEVFKQLAWLWIRDSRTLDILIFTGEQYRNPRLPTWVPDWTAKPLPDNSHVWAPRIPELQKHFRASGEYDAVVGWDKTCLTASGIYIDTVKLGFVASFVATIDSEPPVSLTYTAGGSIRDAVWRTIILDTIVTSSERRRALSSDAEPFTAWWTNMSRYAADPEFEVLSVPTDLRKHFEMSFLAGDLNEMFSTQRGYVGSTMLPPKAGDEVWILYGCRMPILLRPDPVADRCQRAVDQAGGKHYTNIGPCYLHGFMDGEALGEPALPRATVHIN